MPGRLHMAFNTHYITSYPIFFQLHPMATYCLPFSSVESQHAQRQQ
jgi:hypothetical protein